ESIPRLARELAHKEPVARKRAERLLDRIDPRWAQTSAGLSAIDWLGNKLLSGGDEERASAAARLAPVGTAVGPALKALLGATGDRHPPVRQQAGELLDWLDPNWPESSEARAAVRKFMYWLHARTPERVAAIEALGRLGRTARAALGELYHIAEDA